MTEKTNDRELLELAAKAAGYPWRGFAHSGEALLNADMREPEPRAAIPTAWNPLTDDGDALRLAVELRFDIHFEMQTTPGGKRVEIVEIFHSHKEDGSCTCEMRSLGNDHCAATCRAIVRAAAEIGRNMP